MTMVLLISLLFSTTAFFVMFNIKDRILKEVIFAYLVISVMLLAIFRIPEQSSDYGNYVSIYNNLTKSWQIELSMKLIVTLVRNTFNNVIFLFAFYAIFAVSIKGYVFKRISIYPLVTLLAYIAYEYQVQELTQIRMGLVVAFILLSIKPLYEKKYHLFMLIGAIATFFHASAITFVFLPFVCLFNTKRGLIIIFVGCLIAPFFISPIIKNLIPIIIPGGYLQHKIQQYASDSKAITHTFRIATLYRYSIFLFLLYFSRQILKYNKYFMHEMAMYIYGCLLNSLFFFVGLISSRLSELYYPVEILLFPNMLYIFKSKTFAKVLIIFLLLGELIHEFYNLRPAYKF
ncbi:hypothetical protein FACS1894137_02960 [Spirochaetia bacterium]|nr:hypothetical protein FACS1894137_02960 [Spirochaetia bacterium]